MIKIKNLHLQVTHDEVEGMIVNGGDIFVLIEKVNEIIDFLNRNSKSDKQSEKLKKGGD